MDGLLLDDAEQCLVKLQRLWCIHVPLDDAIYHIFKDREATAKRLCRELKVVITPDLLHDEEKSIIVLKLLEEFICSGLYSRHMFLEVKHLAGVWGAIYILAHLASAGLMGPHLRQNSCLPACLLLYVLVFLLYQCKSRKVHTLVVKLLLGNDILVDGQLIVEGTVCCTVYALMATILQK